MKTNREELVKLGACLPGYRRFLKQTDNTHADVDVASLVGGLNTADDLLWLASYHIPKDRLIKLASDCAVIIAKILKSKYDDMDKDLLDSVITLLNNPNGQDSISLANELSRMRPYTLSAAGIRHAMVCIASANSSLYDSNSAAADAAFTITCVPLQGQSRVNQLLIDMFNEFE